MNTLKKIFSILLVFSATAGFSQNEPDAVYHKIVKEYTVHEDGSYDLHYYKELELKSHYSFNRLYGETFIVYNPEFQDLKINDSYTIMKDRKKVKTPDNAFNKVLPRSVSEFPAYNHLREMVVTHTGLALGATIYLDYTLTTDAGMFGGFSVKEDIKRRSPVKEMEIIVHVPEGKELNYKTRNLESAPAESRQEGMKTYTWKLNDIKPFPREGHICEKSYPELFLQAGKNGIRKELNPEKISLRLPDIFKKKVAEITAEEKSEIDKVNVLRDFVNNQIDYSSVDQGYIGNTIRSFDEIYKTNIASYPEKIFLLSGMIQEVGIEAEPILVYPKEKLPVLSDNDQIKLKVNLQGKNFYISELHGKQNLWFNLEEKEARPVVKGKTNQIISFPAGKNQYDFNAKMELDGKSVSAEAEVKLGNHFSPYALFGTDYQKYPSLVSGISMDTAMVERASLNETHAKMRTNSPKEIVKEANDLRMIELPQIEGGVDSWDIDPLLNKRSTHFEIPVKMSESYRVEVEIKNGICINEDVKEEINTSFGSLIVHLENNDDSVVLTRKISLDKKCFNPSEYEQLRGMLRSYRGENIKKLIIK